MEVLIQRVSLNGIALLVFMVFSCSSAKAQQALTDSTLIKRYKLQHDSAIQVFESKKHIMSCAEEVFTMCDTPARYPGDKAQMDWLLAANINYTPELRQALRNTKAKKRRAFVLFIVNKTGGLESFKICGGLGTSGNDIIDKEALRVAATMPDWIPGSQFGYKVCSTQVVLIKFK